MWCGRARVPGTQGHGGTRAACRRRPPHRRAVGYVSAGLATHGAHREPGPGWAPRVDVGAGGGRRVSCSWRGTFGSRAARRGPPRRRPGLWPCVSLPARLLGLLRGARGLGVHGHGSRPPGGQARQRGAGRGRFRVVAGADEDAGLCRGLVGPRVQRVGALLTPGGGRGNRRGLQPQARPLAPPQSRHTWIPGPLVRVAAHSANTSSPRIPQGPHPGRSSHRHAHGCTLAHTRSRAHLKQLRWYSFPSAKCRCTRCTCCPQTPQVLLTEPPAAWPWGGEPLTGLPHLPSSQPPRQRPEDPAVQTGERRSRRRLVPRPPDSAFRVSSLAQGERAGG